MSQAPQHFRSSGTRHGEDDDDDENDADIDDDSWHTDVFMDGDDRNNDDYDLQCG